MNNAELASDLDDVSTLAMALRCSIAGLMEFHDAEPEAMADYVNAVAKQCYGLFAAIEEIRMRVKTEAEK